MKKVWKRVMGLILMLSLLMALAPANGIVAFAEPLAVGTVFADDFESETLNQAPANWTLDSTKLTLTVEKETVTNGEQETENQFVRMTKPEGVKDWSRADTKTFENPLTLGYNRVVIEARVRMSETGVSRHLLRMNFPASGAGNSANNALFMAMKSSNSLYYTNGTAGGDNPYTKMDKYGDLTLARNQWYSLKAVIFPYKKQAAYYIDNVMIGKKLYNLTGPEFQEINAIEQLSFTWRDCNTDYEYLDFDDVKVYGTDQTPSYENQFQNAGFEDGLNQWSGTYIGVETEKAHRGKQSAYISGRTSTTNFYRQAVTVKPQKTYLLSGYVWSNSDAAVMHEGYIDKGPGLARPNRTAEQVSMQRSDGWKRVGLTITSEAIAEELKCYTMFINWDKNTNYWVDDMFFGELRADNVRINGSRTVIIPASGSTEETYTADILNQVGSKTGLTKQTISEWRIAGQTPDGVSLSNGVLTVTGAAQPQTITLQAVCRPDFLGNVDEEVVGSVKVALQSGGFAAEPVYTNDDGEEVRDLPEGGVAKVKAVLRNGTDTAEEAMFVAAQYDGTQLENVDVKYLTLPANGQAVVEDLPDIDTAEMKGKNIKYLLLRKNTLVPLLSKAVTLGEGADKIYVSPTGNDSASGSKYAPLKTLSAAKAAVRRVRAESDLPTEVVLLEGDYLLENSFALTAEDSGTADAPITYRAQQPGTVRLIGGKKLLLSDFVPASGVSAVIDETARENLVQLNLREHGLAEIPPLNYPGAYTLPWVAQNATPPELFSGDTALTLARYPNEGYLTVDSVAHMGAIPRNWQPDKVNTPDYVPPENQDREDGFVLTWTDERIAGWTGAKDARLYGYWYFDWADQTVLLKSVDPEAKTLTSAMPSWYGVLAGQRFYAYNLLEELDIPGEYYIDRDTGILYLYPPQGVEELFLSVMEDTMITLDGASHIRIEDLFMGYTRGSAVEILSGSDNKISNCEITNTGDVAVEIYGEHNGIAGSHLHQVNGGIKLGGGDRTTLTAAGNYATGNHIEEYDRIKKTYNGAVTLDGVGNSVLYNTIHGADHLAIGFVGNDHRIAYNEIYDVLRTTDDAGAIYSVGDWTYRGNRIEHNYIHDLHTNTAGQTGLIYGIYFDNRMSGTTVFGNVIENAPCGVYVHGGRDTIVENNLFINTKISARISSKNIGGTVSELYKRLESVPYTQEPWKSKYPALAVILDNDPESPGGNVFINNAAIDTQGLGSTLPPAEAAEGISQNRIYTSDPGFEDMANKNYRLNPNASVFQDLPGFEQIRYPF